MIPFSSPPTRCKMLHLKILAKFVVGKLFNRLTKLIKHFFFFVEAVDTHLTRILGCLGVNYTFIITTN